MIDVTGLGDPLLSRLEPGQSWLHGFWRVGHYLRVIPGGYKHSLLLGRNAIADEQLRPFYDVLFVVTRGDLLDYRRLKLIWNLNTGVYRRTLDGYVRKSLLRRRLVSLGDLTVPVRDGWPNWAGMAMGPGGISIALPDTMHSREVEISLDSDDSYEIVFSGRNEPPGCKVIVSPCEGDGFKSHVFVIPESEVARGYDTIVITPTRRNGAASVGHVRFPDVRQDRPAADFRGFAFSAM
jgi:arabinofuranosyltransferase